MEIMVTGGNFRGKGAEAMLLTVIRELAVRLPQATFLVLTNDSEPIPWRSLGMVSHVPVSIVQAPPMSLLDLPFGIVSRLLFVERWSRLCQFFRFASRAVAVIDISGYSFMPRGRFPGRTASNHSAKLAISRLAGAQHIVLPQVMGPINGRLDRWLASRALLCAASVTVRDEITWALLDSLGVTKRRSVSVCPDVAFLFPAAPGNSARRILAEIGIGDTPFLALTPNVRVYERSPVEEGENLYLATLVRLVQDIVDDLNVAVLLIPHESSPRGDDDVWLVNQILSRLQGNEQVFALSCQHTAGEIKSIIGNAQLVVGSRYHSLIAALSLHVPCLAISWSHKYETLMKSVDLEDSVFRMNGLEYGSLKRQLFNLWSAREQIATGLDVIVEGFELSVNGLFDQTAEFVKRASLQHDLSESERVRQ